VHAVLLLSVNIFHKDIIELKTAISIGLTIPIDAASKRQSLNIF